MRHFALILSVALLLIGCASDGFEDSGKDFDKTSFQRLADRAAAQGDTMMALQMYEKAISADPTSLPAKWGYARTLQMLGERRGAISVFTELLKTQPDDVELLITLGSLWVQELDGEQAARYATRALDIQPSARAFNVLALAAELQDDTIAAQAAYHSGLLLGGDVNLRSNLGLSQVLRQDFTTGLRYLQAAVNDPNAKPQHRRNLAFGYVLQGKNDLAAQILRLDLNDAAASKSLVYFAKIAKKPTPLARVRALIGGGV